MNKSSIKVFIVDDSNLLIDGLVRFFKESEDIEFIGRANSPYECMQQIDHYIPSIDIILMDVIFPNHSTNGIQLSQKIKEKYPGYSPKIAFMTITDKAIVDVENGFHGIIPKNEGIEELIRKLKAVHYEKATFPPPAKPSITLPEILNSTQKKILCSLLEEDNSNKLKTIFKTNYLESQKKIILRKINQLGLEVDNLKDKKVVELASQYNLCDKEY